MEKIKVLISPNSYKGSASSVEAADYFEKYLCKSNNVEIIKRPVTDGGDGFLDVCKANFNLKIFVIKIPAPFKNKFLRCRIGYDEINQAVYIESADVLGLKVIPAKRQRAIELNSFGLGILLKELDQRNLQKKLIIKKVFVGIGGTGTNDLGLGAASAFGLRIINKNRKSMHAIPLNFESINDIYIPMIKLSFKIFTITDVANPLTGRRGATMMFGKQKGSTDEEIKLIEKGFLNIVKILKQKNYISKYEKLNGSGGGLAAGLKIFFDSHQISASDFILNYLGLKKYEGKVNYVVSGEGFFDEQSLMKKAPGIIIDLFRNSGKKIFLCCGIIDKNSLAAAGDKIIPIEFISFWKTKNESLSLIEESIKIASREILKYITKIIKD